MPLPQTHCSTCGVFHMRCHKKVRRNHEARFDNARSPTDNLAGITEMYVKGLGFTVLAQFTEHEGDEWEQSCAHMLAAGFH